MAFIMTLFVLFAVGMMLIGFVYTTRNEAFLAARSRNAGIAMGLAEAGLQEAFARFKNFAFVPGSGGFAISLASTSSLAPSGALPNQPCPPSTQANYVTYQPAVTYGGQTLAIYPICSTGAFGSTLASAAVQRTVRMYIMATFKQGAHNVIYSPTVNFNSDATPVSGDMYSMGNIHFQSGGAPKCATSPAPGATATNLLTPQVLAGTYIRWDSAVVGCGGNGTSGTYTYECTNTTNQATEVAPTPCPGGTGRTAGLPYNMHPMVPIAMPKNDFLTVMNAPSASQTSAGITISNATQNGIVQPYIPVGQPPAWESMGQYHNDIPLIIASGAFCVNPAGVSPFVLAVSGSCPGGPTWPVYGITGSTTRYVDQALIDDDYSKVGAQTFFQPPQCTAPCAQGGNQNGIRFVPQPPPIDPQQLAQQCSAPMALNVIDVVDAGISISCGPSVQRIDTGVLTESFTGTKASPESLIILNKNSGAVSITGSTFSALPPSCNPLSWFDSYGWGQILATGALSFPSNFAFAGVIFSKSNITFNGDTGLWGAVIVPGGPQSTNYQTVNSTTMFCGGSQMTILNPLLMNYSVAAWQDPTTSSGIR